MKGVCRTVFLGDRHTWKPDGEADQGAFAARFDYRQYECIRSRRIDSEYHYDAVLGCVHEHRRIRRPFLLFNTKASQARPEKWRL